MGICDHIINGENTHWVATSFLCRIKKGKPKIKEPKKASDIGWFPLDNLPKNLSINTQKALLDYEEIKIENF